MGTEHHDRSIAAAVRAVEEGHRAFLTRDADGAYVKVVSDTTPGKWYRNTAHVAGEAADVCFTCKPSDYGTPGRARDHGIKAAVDGTTPCKHAALAARRLERAGLIRWVDPHVDQGIAYPGRWVGATATVALVDDLAPAVEPERQASDAPGYRAAMSDLDAETFRMFAGSGR